jgi:hypothetical protein
LYSCGAALDTYRWKPNLPSAGRYDVYVWWSSNPNRSGNVPVSVKHSGGDSVKNYNQKTGGGQWVLHGRYSFAVGSVGYVEATDANGQGSADAVRFVPLP